ncbi:FecR domain-containing protein [bacterium SCSIO 12696]|nr:FecR domain-containing protein [bacterium SCSIO 12696]
MTDVKKALMAFKTALFGFLCLLVLSTWAAEDEEPEWIYFVEKGDTLWQLCAESMGNRNVTQCWRNIQKHNGIGIPRHLRPGTHLRIPVGWIQTIPVAAVVQFASGDVSQTAYGASASIAVKNGDSVFLGSQLTVGEGAAVLVFNDGSELLLRHHSELVLQALTTHGNRSARSTLKLNKGALDAEAFRNQNKNRFKVKTPGAVAAVRGTKFRVAAKPGDTITHVEVLEGGVDVAAGHSGQQVPGGFGVKASKGQPVGKPVKLLPAPRIDGVKSTYDAGAVAVGWAAVNGAVGYQLELYQGSSGGEVIVQNNTVDNQYQFDQLPTGTYRLVVRAVSADGLRGKDSTAASFQTLEKLTAPVLNVADTRYKSKRLVTAWEPTANASGYLVEASSQPDFSQILFSESLSKPTFERKESIKGSFYVRVKAVSADGRESEYSDAVQIENQSWDWAAIAVSAVALLLLL